MLQIEELKNRELSGDLPSDEALVMEDSYSADLQSSNHWGVSLNISRSVRLKFFFSAPNAASLLFDPIGLPIWIYSFPSDLLLILIFPSHNSILRAAW